MKYDILIENLENIINNWYDKGSLKEVIRSPHEGLCDNIKFETIYEIPDACFEAWKYFTGNICYPVDGCDEYDRGLDEAYSLFNNPKRLHLAVHMLQWFRFHNI